MGQADEQESNVGQANTYKWAAFWAAFFYALVLPLWATADVLGPMLYFCAAICGSTLGGSVWNNLVLK
jgi:hypothetical protein